MVQLYWAIIVIIFFKLLRAAQFMQQSDHTAITAICHADRMQIPRTSQLMQQSDHIQMIILRRVVHRAITPINAQLMQ